MKSLIGKISLFIIIFLFIAYSFTLLFSEGDSISIYDVKRENIIYGVLIGLFISIPILFINNKKN
jgi:hypothetical protein